MVLAEAYAPYRDTISQPEAEQGLRIPRITPQEFERRFGSPPAIPLASKLYADYVDQRNREIAEGTYVPGELLPVNLNQQLLRQVFINLGRNNTQLEEKNELGEIIQEGTEIDWYNPSDSFLNKGIETIAMRLEPRNSELSIVGFMKKNQETEEYEFDETLPIINMAQDPSITPDDNGNIILGVVKIHANEDGKITNYKTLQFRGPDVSNMKVFQTLPGKDQRPVQIKNPHIVRGFNRPQEGRGWKKLGGPGKLGNRDYSTWDEYKKDTRPFTEEDLLVTNFQKTNHGGPNFPLPDGQVYGHIAEKEYDNNGNVVRLHYFGTWALTDQETGQILYQMNHGTGRLEPLIKVVTARSDFDHLSKYIPDKSEKTHDVVFMAGVKKLKNGKVKAAVGIGDARAGWKIMPDPMDDVDPNNLYLVA